MQAGVDPPFHAELRNVLAGGFTGLTQIHGCIETNPAAANDRYAFAHWRFIAQDVEIAQHFWMFDPLDRRHTWLDPAGKDHFVESVQIVCADKVIQLQSHASHVDHPAVVAQGFIEFFFAGDLFGDIKLPANFAMCVKQRDVMSACGGINGEGEARRTRTDNRQILWYSCRNDRHFSFMAGARIDQARGDFADKDLVQTGLVTADTGVDLIRSSGLRF